MQTRYVSEEWKSLTFDAAAPGWRVVDGLSRASEVSRRAAPERLRRLIPLVPGLLLVGSLAAGLVALAVRSLHAYDSFLAVQGEWSLTQYTSVLNDPQFHVVAARTILMAVVLPIAAVAVGVPYAMTMTRCPRRWMRLMMLIALFIPLLTGDITRTYGLLAVLGPAGPVEWISSQVGFRAFDLVGSPWAIGIGIVQTLLPAAVVVLLPAVLRIDPELSSAAMTLGASPRVTFWRITLPQLRTGVVAAVAATFALTMAAFADPAILGRGLQSFVSNFLQDRYLAVGNPAQGAAIGVLLLVIVSLGTALLLVVGRPRRGRRR